MYRVPRVSRRKVWYKYIYAYNCVLFLLVYRVTRVSWRNVARFLDDMYGIFVRECGGDRGARLRTHRESGYLDVVCIFVYV